MRLISEMAKLLRSISSTTTAPVSFDPEKFPTAALAVIDFPLDDWSKIHPKSGRLDRFVVPRALDSETA